jgi:hypothetical protein
MIALSVSVAPPFTGPQLVIVIRCMSIASNCPKNGAADRHCIGRLRNCTIQTSNLVHPSKRKSMSIEPAFWSVISFECNFSLSRVHPS